MTTPRILCFAGSSRRDSFNKRLAQLAAGQVRALGAEATFVDLRDHAMPLYDSDLESASGLPDSVVSWKAVVGAHDGLLVACPEYNSSITPLLKNAIDWASRPAPGEKPLAVLRGKVAGLVAASPGALGGLRGLVVVRAILGNISVHVVPTQCALGTAHKAFDEGGALVDDAAASRLGAVVQELVTTTSRLVG